MLKKILEKQLGILVDRDARNLDKALKLLIIAMYTLTVVQLQKYLHILEYIIPPDSALGLSDQILLKLVSSMLAIAGYFLLLEMTDFLQYCASEIMTVIQFFFQSIFQIYPESEIQREYEYNHNIVRKYDVEKYLEVSQDERVKEIYDKHNRFVRCLMDRKRDVMGISILLALNFCLNHEKPLILEYSRPYCLVTIGLVIWSAFLPYENMMFMYIRNNKIRD